jgi:outer membrane biogenesis lipoprotein LolB
VEEGPRRTTTIQAYILNGGFGSTGENQKGGLSFFWEQSINQCLFTILIFAKITPTLKKIH